MAFAPVSICSQRRFDDLLGDPQRAERVDRHADPHRGLRPSHRHGRDHGRELTGDQIDQQRKADWGIIPQTLFGSGYVGLGMMRLFAVLGGVVLSGLFGVVFSLYVMAVRQMGVMTSFLVVARFVVLRGNAMISRSVLVVFRRLAMMFCAFFTSR